MRMSITGALKTKEESKKLQNFSKQWIPGDTLRAFYPIYWDEQDGLPYLLGGCVWGHQVSDIKGLGLKTAFIPSLTEFADGVPVGAPDITYRFSMIAGLFPRGAKAIEEAKLMAKRWPSEGARKDALKALEDKYDTKNNMNAEKAIISRAMLLIMTECLVINVAGGVPQKGKEAIVTQPLSKQNIRRLDQILKNPQFRPEPGSNFIEIEWAFPVATEKSESAKAVVPTGVSKEMSLKETRPTDWDWINGMLSMVADSSEMIVKRATRDISESRIAQAITQYVFLNSEYLDALDEDGVEQLVNNVPALADISISGAITNEDILSKIDTALSAVPKDMVSKPASGAGAFKAPEAVTEEVPQAEVPTPVQTLATPEEILSAPTLQQLSESSFAVNTDDVNLDNLDFSSLMD